MLPIENVFQEAEKIPCQAVKRDRAAWEKHIADLYREMLDIRVSGKKTKLKNVVSSGGLFLTEPFIGKRKEEILKSVLSLEERLKGHEFAKEIMLESWIRTNLVASPKQYGGRTQSTSPIITAATIFILDNIDIDALVKEVVLPTEMASFEYADEEDIGKSMQYSDTLIAKINYVISNRNNSEPDPEGESMPDYPLLDEYSVRKTKNTDAKYRSCYEQIISLIPDDVVETAVARFAEKYAERYEHLLKTLSEAAIAVEEAVQKHNASVEALNAAGKDLVAHVSRNAIKPRKQKRAIPAIQPAPFRMQPPATPNVGLNYAGLPTTARDIASALENADELSDKRNKLRLLEWVVDKNGREVNEKTDHFISLANGAMHIFDEENRDKAYIRKDHSLISIGDPYEICFAYIYLVDHGSDMLWLFGPSTSFMNEVMETLPCGPLTCDETLLPEAHEHAKKTRSNKASKTLRRIYDMQYTEGEDCREAFNLAQIVYALTGYVLPRPTETDEAELTAQHYMLTSHGVSGADADFIIPLLWALNRKKAENIYEYGTSEDYVGWDDDFDADEEDEAPDCVAEDPFAEKEKELRAEIKRLRSDLHSAENTAKEMKSKLEAKERQAESYRKEMADLRTIVFTSNEGLDEEPEYEQGAEAKLPYNVVHNTIVFGGHNTWAKAIKPMLTGNVRFVDRDFIFDPSIVRNAKTVWIQTNAMSHSYYDRIVTAARNNKVQIRYFTNASATIGAIQVMEWDEQMEHTSSAGA